MTGPDRPITLGAQVIEIVLGRGRRVRVDEVDAEALRRVLLASAGSQNEADAWAGYTRCRSIHGLKAHVAAHAGTAG